MSKYCQARIAGADVIIETQYTLGKKDAMRRIQDGGDVYCSKKRAHTLAEALSQGQGSMKHAAHVQGGYRHYHDVNHVFNGHIFYGRPKY